jgi:hypothetical protein
LQACKLGFSTQKIRYPILFEELRAARGTADTYGSLKNYQK